MNETPTSADRDRGPVSDDSSALPFALVGVIVLAMAYGGWLIWKRTTPAAASDKLPAASMRIALSDFELEERSGQPFRSADMRGKVWVASYFFASCTGTCIRVSENIQQMVTRPDLADITWVSITCDPDNDTLAVLRDYASRWNADPERWLFCRGDFDYLREVARGMNLRFAHKMHADHAVVIDKAGKIRGLFDATSSYQCDRLRALLQTCLAEEDPREPTEVPELPEQAQFRAAG